MSKLKIEDRLLTERLCRAVEEYLREVDNPMPDAVHKRYLREYMRSRLIDLARGGDFISNERLGYHIHMSRSGK